MRKRIREVSGGGIQVSYTVFMTVSGKFTSIAESSARERAEIG